jgi:hypothetical protein
MYVPSGLAAWGLANDVPGRPAPVALATADSIAFGTADAHRAALASLVDLPPP